MCYGTPAWPETGRYLDSKVKKRSLKRAYGRAQQQGYAWYKGKYLSVHDFERMGCTPSKRACVNLDTVGVIQDWHRCSQHHAPRKRLVVWQWNCSGLSAAKLDELKAWLYINKVDLAVLVETRWQFDSLWEDQDWSCLHSGEGKGKGKGIFTSGSIRWQNYDSGRLMHIRLSLNPRPLDIIACYQHVYQDTMACRTLRDQWWTLLDSVLSGLPHRNSAVILGDFNCGLSALAGSVGTSDFRWQHGLVSGRTHPDQSRFLNLLRTHSLVALNSWTCTLGPTYVHGTQASRIDWICVRRPLADGTAKQVRYLWDSPFLSQTDHGHVPMMCTLAQYWIPTHSMPRIQKVTLQQRQYGRHAYMMQTAEWHECMHDIQTVIDSSFEDNDLSVDDQLQAMHQQVLGIYCTHFPPGRAVRSASTWRPAMSVLQTKWDHRRAMLRHAVCTLGNVFKGWYHAVRFMILKRAHKKFASEIRQTRFQEVIHEAAQAANKHDTHRLFSIINTYAPKAPKRQIQLRNHAGNMATPIESAAILNKYVSDTWAGPATFNMQFDAPPGVPFSERQLERAIAAIPTTKAVAKPFAPGVVWRQLASFLAPILYGCLTIWWTIEQMFVTLNQMNLQVNPRKSVAMLEMRGSASFHLRRRFVTGSGAEQCVKIEAPGLQTLYIPLKSQAKYLGVIISYGAFEMATLRHRFALMKTGFQRLRRWLLGHGLTLRQRYQLWRQCIFPIFQYGICAVGLTSSGIRVALTQLTIMLRQRAHDHAYLTRRNNVQAFQHHHIPSPIELLRETAAGLLRSITHRQPLLKSHDIALNIDWTHLQPLLQQLDNWQAPSSLEHTLQSQEAWWSTPFFQCALCDFCTSDVSAFRRHCTTIHGQYMRRTQHVQISDYAVAGLPTCKTCGKTFTTWRIFQAHLERGCQEHLPGPSLCVQPEGDSGSALASLRVSMSKSPDEAQRGLRLLTEQELDFLKQQEFGARLLAMVQNRSWHQMAREREACSLLAKQCILCSVHFSRTQELNQHYRLQHSDLWEHAQLKAIQLTNINCSDSPCDYCGAFFAQHTCPIWTQIAVLLVNGAGLTTLSASALSTEHQRCDLCQLCFSTATELIQHLRVEHGLQGLSFVEARDSLDNSFVCSHCGQIFLTMSGLKTHIVQGRCGYFNPLASSESKDVDDRWRRACLDGQMLDILHPPMARLQLTVACQFCGKGCQRAADLVHHLQSSHAKLWRDSQRLTQVMLAVFSADNHCYCNPRTGAKRGYHICPALRQLAMCHLRLKQEPFAPIQITDQMLANLLSPKLSREIQFRLEQLLAGRQFSQLWQEPDMQQLLRSQCLCCGIRLAPADLALHLREEHNCKHNTFLFYMEQLLPVLHASQTDDYSCNLCLQIYNLPAAMKPDEPEHVRTALAQSHLRGSCPVLLQCALTLGALLHGGTLSHGPAGVAGIQSDCGGFTIVHRSISASDTQSQAAEASAPRRPRLSGGDRKARPGHGGYLSTDNVATGSAPDSNHGPPAHQTRSRDTKHSKDGSIHTFFESRTKRSTGIDDGRDGEVEAKHGGCIDISDDAAAETAPHDSLAEGPSNPSGPAGGVQGHGSFVPDLSSEGLADARPIFPVSSVGCQEPETCAGQEAAGQLWQDGTTLGGASGDDVGQRIGSALSCTEIHHHQGFDADSLEAADQSSIRPPIRIALPAGSQCHMDGIRSKHETTYHGSDEHGISASANADQSQGTRKGEVEIQAQDHQTRALSFELLTELIYGMSGLVLLNDKNWCYANSTTYSMIWSLLCLSFSSSDLWGPRYDILVQFICSCAAKPAMLKHVDWFCHILSQWGSSQGQKDCAEFIHCTLTWLSSPAFDMRWERRLETSEGTHVIDRGTACMPLKLIFTHEMHDWGTCTLQAMLTSWCQEDSHCAALLAAPPCLCLQLDRFYQTRDGQIIKTDCCLTLDTELTVPVFTSAGIQHEGTSYIPVAAIAHLGADCAGHFRALLKMQPTVYDSHPVQWLATEDSQPPIPIWQIPPWMIQNATVVWLVRTDLLQLPCYPPRLLVRESASTANADDSTDDLLQLLQAQAGVNDI
eukprot:s3272_g4.t1